MRKILLALLLSFTASANAFWNTDFDKDDIEHFQSPIVSTVAPVRPLKSTYNLYNQTVRLGLAAMLPIVPTFNNKGNLFASWNPSPNGFRKRPTIVIAHGGHGLISTDFATALWFKNKLDYNVLVLDSYWSRGIEENWATMTKYGANMRMLDALAAGQWLVQQGVDNKSMFLMGGSQGGWTVLRTMTDEPFMREANLYRGGIALYPNCDVNNTKYAPKLGSYHSPVIIFVGGRDTATPYQRCSKKVFTDAAKWIIYPDQTHSWDSANRGAENPAEDGYCLRAMNIYNKFEVCRDNKTTEDMQQHIVNFINELLKEKS
jgi:dienelactone hydrolase